MTDGTPRREDWTDGVPVLLLEHCRRCQNRWYLPHRHCLVCGAGDSDARPAEGAGLCVAVTRLHVTADGGSEPVTLTLVELDEGPVVMGRAHDADLAPGDRARLEFLEPAPGSVVPSFAKEKEDS